jgi:small conductance mechanosensitive channel
MPEKWNGFVAPVYELVINNAVRVVGVLVVLWVAMRVARWLGDNVTDKLENREFDSALARFIGSFVRYGVTVAAVLSCMSVFGIETTSFAAIIGAAGLAVGLAFQGTLSNFAAGVMLLVFRPFKIGDVVNAGGTVGAITDLGLFATSFDTVDNRRIIVPNSAVAGGTIENVTFHPKRRVDIDVGASYDASITETREALERAITKVASRLKKSEDHMVFLAGLGGSSVDWQVRVWCKTDKYWDVWQETVQAIKEELDGASISIPYPNMEVHLHKPAP